MLVHDDMFLHSTVEKMHYALMLMLDGMSLRLAMIVMVTVEEIVQ